MTDYQPRPGTKERKQNQKTVERILYGCVIFVVLLLAALLWVYSRIEDREADEDGCLTQGVDPSHFVIILDTTDSLPPVAKAAARQQIDERLQAIESFGRVSVFSVAPDETAPAHPALSLCSPPPRSWMDRVRGPEDPYADSRENMQRIRTAVHEGLAQNVSAPNSPILEAITEISRQDDFKPDRPNRSLLLVSDLLQKSTWFDVYQYQSDADIIRRLEQWGRFPDLDGVDVTALMVTERGQDRDGTLELQARRFWTTVFAQAGADARIQSIRQTEPAMRSEVSPHP